MPGYYSAQLYSYPARRWRKKRRQYLLNHQNNYNSAKEAEHSQSGENVSTLSNETNSNVSSSAGSSNFGLPNSGPSVAQNGQNGIGGSVGGIGPGNSTLNDTFEDSKDSWLRDFDDGSDLPDAGKPSTTLSLISMTTRSTRRGRKSLGGRNRLRRSVNTLMLKSRFSATCVVPSTKPDQVSRTITPTVTKTMVTATTRQMGSVKKRHNSSTTTATLLLATLTIPTFTKAPATAIRAQVPSDLVLDRVTGQLSITSTALYTLWQTMRIQVISVQ